eukprot:TRINITY_DN3391_c0_g1_i10.p1 TRINITY_DN3391_c0_g1~~TRINITY_DN3391_c0_g1_i10.p1  ORF type:complete len:164 (+),score=19.79 TRINITY_DN3391_c0_g1_i10:59-493(+)
MSSLGLDSSRYQLSMQTQEQRPGPGVAYRPGNIRYAFIACHGEADAQAFVNAFQGFQFENVKSHKRLLIEPSTSKRKRAWASFSNESRAHRGQDIDVVFAEGRRLEVNRGFNAAEYDVQTSNLHLHTSAPPACSEVPPTRLCHF